MGLSKTTLLTPKLVQKIWPNSDLYRMAKKCRVVRKNFNFWTNLMFMQHTFPNKKYNLLRSEKNKQIFTN